MLKFKNNERTFKNEKEVLDYYWKNFNTKVSFSSPPEDLEVVFQSAKPQPTTELKVVYEDGIEFIDGKWYVKYSERDMFSGTTDEEGVVTTKAEHETNYLEELKYQENESYKQQARQAIRQIKDFEDDLTDLKKVVQFMARGFAGLWATMPQEQKDLNPYKDNFDLFTQAVSTTQLRLDLELDQVAKISKVLADEAEFAGIVKTEYLDKVV